MKAEATRGSQTSLHYSFDFQKKKKQNQTQKQMFMTAEAPDRKSMLVRFNRTERQNTDSYFGKKVGAFRHQTRISTVNFQISHKPSVPQM